LYIPLEQTEPERASSTGEDREMGMDERKREERSRAGEYLVDDFYVSSKRWRIY
jgi:hypothetical protein